MKSEPATSQFVVEVHQSLSAIPAQDWDACANPPGQPHNPFVRHAFLSAVEQSGSATGDTGWLGQHLPNDEKLRVYESGSIRSGQARLR